MRKSIVVAIIVVGFMLAASCSIAAGNPPVSSPSPTASPQPHVRASPASPSLIAGGDCPVTKPEPVFTAPPPAPHKPPDYYKSNWFGTADLWTMLRRGGDVWQGLPRTPDGLTQKTFWWSANWPYRTENEPDITVVGRRLDGPGEFKAGHPGTNAGADFGIAMLVGIDVPTTGCWRLTGEYRGTELGYVVLVED